LPLEPLARVVKVSKLIAPFPNVLRKA